jgi:hypothetical protein
MIPSSPTKRAASLLVLSFCLCAPCPLAHAQPAPAQDAGQSADQLFDKGRALYQSGKLQAAHDALAAAWALKNSYDIAANLATTELELGLARDAAEHFAYCIRTFPSTGSKKNLAAVKRSLEEARTKVGALEIKVSVDGAEVVVDGKSVGHAPFKEEVFVEPGARTVEAKLAGYEPAKKDVQLSKGGAAQVSLVLVAAKPTSPAPGRAAEPSLSDPGKGSEQNPPPAGAGGPNRTVLIAGGAAAGAALVAGVVFTIVANGKASAAEALKKPIEEQYGPTACATSPPASGCEALHQAREPQYTFSNLALWSFVGAGVLGAGTAVYALVAPRGAPKTAVRITPVAGAQGGAVLVSGAW